MHYTPASNAVKHGLSSKVHMPAHAQEPIRQIEEELTELYLPESEQETRIVRELSVAYWKKQEHDRLYGLRVEKEMRIADQLFDRQHQEKFQEDLTHLKQDPQFFRDILGRTYLGAKFFQELWSRICDSLGPKGSGMTLSQACSAALSEQSSANVQEIGADGWWIFERFIASSPCPQEQIDEWLKQSGAKASQSAAHHAHHHWQNAPDPGESKNQLQIRATERANHWREMVDQLKPEYELAKHEFGMMTVGLGLGDKQLMNESRLALRYWTSAQGSVEKLERRLDALKKGRELQRHRLLQSEERKTKRLEQQNNRRYNQAGLELWEADQVDKHGPIPSAYESIKQRDLIENGYPIESFEDQDGKTAEMVQETPDSKRLQALTVQHSMTPEQNDLHSLVGDVEEFHEWPDSDFTDPRNERAVRMLEEIKDETEAVLFCIQFSAEQYRRKSSISALQSKTSRDRI